MTAHDELIERIRCTQADCPDSLAAADAIEQLQRDLAFQKEVTDAARQQQAELLERAEGLERDAARYRWLRRQAIAVRNYASGNPNWEIDWALRGESFDDAVDAALAQKEGS